MKNTKEKQMRLCKFSSQLSHYVLFPLYSCAENSSVVETVSSVA